MDMAPSKFHIICEARLFPSSILADILMLASLYVSIIILVAALLFEAVGRLEPNRRLAIVLKCTILVSGGAAIAKQLCLEGLGRPYRSLWPHRFST